MENKVSLVHNYYETNDYRLFVNSDINRDVDMKNVKKLAESIARIGLIQPINVAKQGKKFHVIDGFHRLEACILAGKPVKYIIEDQIVDNVEVMTELNRLRKSWVNADYVKSYLAAGNQNYVQYMKFVETYPDFPNNALGAILCVSRGERFNANDFKSGSFKVGDILTATNFAEDLMAIKPYNKVYCNVKFVRAFMHIWRNPRYNHQVFLNSLQKPKFKRHFEGLDNHSRMLTAIYEVYNDAQRVSNRIEYGDN